MIRLEQVSKEIKGKVVLDNVNITFEEGHVYGIQGVNGSGKTMLMRMICGLIYPTGGKVLVEGKQLGKDLSFPKNIGVLIENPVFLDSYTGLKNLEILASLNGDLENIDVRTAMKRVGLEPDDRRKYKKYSLGMKQRLGIAAVIMENPKILVFDEPLNALDAEGVSLFSKIIMEEKLKEKLIIISCHDEKKLIEYADTMIMMENGRISDIIN